MKNKIIIGGLLSALVSFAGVAYAVGPNEDSGAGLQSQSSVQSNSQTQAGGVVGATSVGVQIKTQDQAQLRVDDQTGVGTGDQVQLQSQDRLQDNTAVNLQTQDKTQLRLEDKAEAGTADQVQLQTQERLQDGTGTGTQSQVQDQSRTENQDEQRRVVTEQRKNEVADAVHAILQVANRNGGIGDQVSTIARTQLQNQQDLEASLQKVQSRSSLAKFFIGANYGEINNAEKLLEQNRQQIQELNQIQEKITNKTDQASLQLQVQTLEQANLQIQNSLSEAGGGFSLLGWMFRMFSN